MDSKAKPIIRKCIYFVIFALMIGAFIYLGEKYNDNAIEEVKVMSDYYNVENLNNENYTVITGQEFIGLIKKGKNIVLVGSKTSDWSTEYLKHVNDIIIDRKIDNVYYYDINNDKAQKNSTYYRIKELLKGYLTTTDGSEGNLLAPSLYIIDNGTVMYYNTDTVAMKNTISIEEYWTQLRTLAFKDEINSALNKYYLNN